MRSLSNLSAAAAFLCLAIFGTPAMACHEGDTATACESGHTPGGIEISAVNHDEVAAVANHFSEIMHLANTLASNPAYAGNPVMAEILELRSYTRWQQFYSLYGMVPDFLWSNANPFDRPLHASHAAAREMMQRMNSLAGADSASPAARLYNTMVLENGFLCTNSALTFTTGTTVGPDWSRTDTTPYLQALAAMGLLLAGVFGVGLAAHRRKSLTYVHQLHYT